MNSAYSTIHLNEVGAITVEALYAIGDRSVVNISLGPIGAILATPACVAELATKLNAFLAANKRPNTIAALAEGGMK